MTSDLTYFCHICYILLELNIIVRNFISNLNKIKAKNPDKDFQTADGVQTFNLAINDGKMLMLVETDEYEKFKRFVKVMKKSNPFYKPDEQSEKE